MTPTHRKKFVLLLPVLVTLMAVQTVEACECRDSDDSTLGRFETARFVVVNRIISVNKQPAVETIYRGAEVIREPIEIVTSITTIVEKVYKGDLKAGDQMIFGQGKHGDCFTKFRDEDVGARFLFYLEPSERKPKLWYPGSCGRSKPLPNYSARYIENAAADLLYLDKMNEVRSKTRIAGTLISYQGDIVDGGSSFKKIAGRKVQIVGNGQSYEALTNEDGVYEIYDLPAGAYEIKPDGKQGWEIDKRSVFGGSRSTKDDGSAQVSLKAGRHASADFFFKVDNRLSGRVFDRSGRPLPRVCLRLFPTQLNVSKYFKREDCTDANGRFEIKEIPFASYVVVINDDDKISSRQPFRRFYYPAVTDREKAQIVSIVEGVTEYPLDIHVPEMQEVVTVTGKVLSADSKPVVFAHVAFTPEQTDPRIDGRAFARTNEQGNFSLTILKGLAGELSAAVMLDGEEFKLCPAVLRVGGEISLDRTTEGIRVQAERRIDGVDLRFPFSSCNREKIRSLIKVD